MCPPEATSHGPGAEADAFSRARATLPLMLEHWLSPIVCPNDVVFTHLYGDRDGPVRVEVEWKAERGALGVDLIDEGGQPLQYSAPEDYEVRGRGHVYLGKNLTGGHLFLRIKNTGAAPIPCRIHTRTRVYLP
jgi:hypothetical protein